MFSAVFSAVDVDVDVVGCAVSECIILFLCVGVVGRYGKGPPPLLENILLPYRFVELFVLWRVRV